MRSFPETDIDPMLNFLSLEFASFLYNIEKGGGGLALNINRI